MKLRSVRRDEPNGAETLTESSEPALMPEHRALLAVDMIESGGSRPEHLGQVPDLVREPVHAALRAVGLNRDSAQDEQFTGDGFLRAYPSEFLPALIDMVSVLDELLATRNRSTKPEVRLRIAVHLGPLPLERGFHRPNIDLNRLLGAEVFKRVIRHCREHITNDALTTALIVSNSAYKTVFGGDYTQVLRRGEFASLPIVHNEFNEDAWVRITGVHPTQLENIPIDGEPTPEAPQTPISGLGHAPGERSISNQGTVDGNLVTGDGNSFTPNPTTNVSNYVGGRNAGVQAGTFNGRFNQGEDRR